MCAEKIFVKLVAARWLKFSAGKIFVRLVAARRLKFSARENFLKLVAARRLKISSRKNFFETRRALNQQKKFAAQSRAAFLLQTIGNLIKYSARRFLTWDSSTD
ncbi:MAG: hypothetical protein IJR52_09215 [Selenomonadaceae bacterium]|nr:hypothetical protein [Selenomonadaceae bacterium]MBQ9497734.1 hypothetical protein [Selenomonadaceae bacterium]